MKEKGTSEGSVGLRARPRGGRRAGGGVGEMAQGRV